MTKDKISFVNEKLKWGYIADATPYYNGVFEPQIADWATESEETWPNCSIIELTNLDVRGIYCECWNEFIDKLKEKGIKLTAHDSFLRNEFYNPETNKSDINLGQFFSNPELSKKGNITNFFWYVVPNSYNGSSPAYKKSIEQGFEDIDFASDNGADRMTIHVTEPGTPLDKSEFQEYISRWKKLNDYGKNKAVDILVETGGVSIEQILELKQDGAKFNLDTAHAMLDGIDVLELYKEIKDNVLEVHLSMTKNGQDFHEGLDYQGTGYSSELRTINSEIVKSVNSMQETGMDVALVLEVKPSDKNINFLYNVLKGEK